MDAQALMLFFSILSSLKHDVCSICHCTDIEKCTCPVSGPRDKYPEADARQRMEVLLLKPTYHVLCAKQGMRE